MRHPRLVTAERIHPQDGVLPTQLDDGDGHHHPGLVVPEDAELGVVQQPGQHRERDQPRGHHQDGGAGVAQVVLAHAHGCAPAWRRAGGSSSTGDSSSRVLSSARATGRAADCGTAKSGHPDGRQARPDSRRCLRQGRLHGPSGHRRAAGTWQSWVARHSHRSPIHCPMNALPVAASAGPDAPVDRFVAICRCTSYQRDSVAWPASGHAAAGRGARPRWRPPRRVRRHCRLTRNDCSRRRGSCRPLKSNCGAEWSP